MDAVTLQEVLAPLQVAVLAGFAVVVFGLGYLAGVRQ